jgi:parvulin-like peptidyl-prolyl isomerase
MSVDAVIDRLHRFQLYPELIYEILTDNLVEQTAIDQSIELDYPSTEYAQKYSEIAGSIGCQGINERQLAAICDRELKLQQFKLALWGSEIESYFAAQGGGLDRVVLSILQVVDGSLAQELFFRIQSGEASFAEIAFDYSQGIHAQNGGILGPLLLRELTPEIRHIVERLEPGALSLMFQSDRYFTYFRLDERAPAQLDNRMRQFLLDELFDNWLESVIRNRLPMPQAPIICAHLSRSKLLVKYLRETIVEETLDRWERSSEFDLVGDRQQALLEIYKQVEFRHLVRSRFLEVKSQLDRVLCSTIQVKNRQLAEELYCQVQLDSRSFTRIATAYADSPVAKRGGVIGPISALQLHPLIQHHLMGLQPKQLSPIFQLDEHFIFLRLDRWLTVKFTPEIERQLIDELFEEWLQQQIRNRLNTISIDRTSNFDLPIAQPVNQFPPQSNSQGEEIAIFSDPDLNPAEPIGTFAPTSSFFLPQISPNGEILPSYLMIVQHSNSSFFLPQQPDIPIIAKNHRHFLVKQIAAFCSFLGLFLARLVE